MIKAVFSPSSRFGILLLISDVSKFIRPRKIPRKVPKIPKEIAALGAKAVHGPIRRFLLDALHLPMNPKNDINIIKSHTILVTFELKLGSEKIARSAKMFSIISSC